MRSILAPILINNINIGLQLRHAQMMTAAQPSFLQINNMKGTYLHESPLQSHDGASQSGDLEGLLIRCGGRSSTSHHGPQYLSGDINLDKRAPEIPNSFAPSLHLLKCAFAASFLSCFLFFSFFQAENHDFRIGLPHTASMVTHVRLYPNPGGAQCVGIV